MTDEERTTVAVRKAWIPQFRRWETEVGRKKAAVVEILLQQAVRNPWLLERLVTLPRPAEVAYEHAHLEDAHGGNGDRPADAGAA